MESESLRKIGGLQRRLLAEMETLDAKTRAAPGADSAADLQSMMRSVEQLQREIDAEMEAFAQLSVDTTSTVSFSHLVHSAQEIKTTADALRERIVYIVDTARRSEEAFETRRSCAVKGVAVAALFAAAVVMLH